jgi:hypothetical protein
MDSQASPTKWHGRKDPNQRHVRQEATLPVAVAQDEASQFVKNGALFSWDQQQKSWFLMGCNQENWPKNDGLIHEN